MKLDDLAAAVAVALTIGDAAVQALASSSERAVTVMDDPLAALDFDAEQAQPCGVRDRRRSWRFPTPATWRAYVQCDLCGKRYSPVCDHHPMWLREEMASVYGGCRCMSGRCDGKGEIVALL